MALFIHCGEFWVDWRKGEVLGVEKWVQRVARGKGGGKGYALGEEVVLRRVS